MRLLRLTLLFVVFAGATTLVGGPSAAQLNNRDRQTRDVAGPAYRNTLELEVPGVVRNDQITLRRGALPVHVANQRAIPVNVRLAVDVQAHGARKRHDLPPLSLEPRASKRLELPVASLGITPERLESPAILTLRAHARDASGEVVDGLVVPAVYLHQRGSDVIVYDEQRLVRRYAGGILPGTPSDLPGRDRFPGSTEIVAGPAAGEFDPEAEPPVLGSGDKTICIHWSYQSADHGAGERFYASGEPIAARGVKFTTFQSGVPSGTPRYANSDTGCSSLPLVAGKIVKVTVFAEAKIGVNQNILIRAYESLQEKTSATPADDNLKKWSFYLIVGNSPMHLYVPVGESSTLMALSTFPAWALDRLSPIGEEKNASLSVIHRSEKTNSDADLHTVNMATPQADKKFTYGHEVGHWFARNQGIDFSGNYEHDGKSEPCWSDDAHDYLWHLLRSSERNTPAFNEGLAHFFSTYVWNGPGRTSPRFRYYKDMSAYTGPDKYYGDLHAGYNRVDMAATTDSSFTLGGQRRWRNTRCTDDDRTRYSVELDWARFLWNYLEGNFAGERPTFAQLISQLKIAYLDYYKPTLPAKNGDPTNAPYDTYFNLRDALSAPPLNDFLGRFTHYAELYGVDE